MAAKNLQILVKMWVLLPSSTNAFIDYQSKSSSISSIGSIYCTQEHCGMRHLPTFAREWLFSDGSCAWSM